MEAYAGLDLHGDNVYCGITDEKDKRLFERKLPCEVEAVAQALEPYRKQLKVVVVESTFNWYWLVDGLQERGYPVLLANPAAIRQYDGLKHSDDKSDAFYLAHLSRLGILPQGYIYPKAIRPVRDLLRRRMKLVQDRTRQILTLEGILARETGKQFSVAKLRKLTDTTLRELISAPHVLLAIKDLQAHIAFIEEQIDRTEQVVLEQVESCPAYERLFRIPGIGRILAMTILLETGDIRRFKSAGCYASYVRAVKSERTTNDRKKGEGNTKSGNKYLAWAYVEAANFMPRTCPEARKYLQRKRARAVQALAIKSLAAKISKACYFILRDNVEFDLKRLFG